MALNSRKKKSTASKAIVGGIVTSSKFRKVFLIVTAVLLLATVGYAGYNKYHEHTLKAHAASWKKLNLSDYGMQFYGCADVVDSPYGKLYKIRVMFDKTYMDRQVKTENPAMVLRILRPYGDGSYSKVISATSSKAWWGNVTVLEAYASVGLADRFSPGYLFSNDVGSSYASNQGDIKSPAGLAGYSCN